jgi:outer membrane protein TolC
VSAAPLSDEHWTVGRAIQRALEANSDFLAAKAEYERQQGIRIQIRARLLPQLSLVASGEERAKYSIDYPPNSINGKPDKSSSLEATSYDARLQLQQLVFDGLGAWNDVKRYKATETQARFMVEAAAHQTVALVRQAFDAVLWRRDALETEQQRVVALRQVVHWTERKQSLGEVAEFEMFRAQAELKLADAALAQATSEVAKAEQTFRRMLMIPDNGRPLSLDGSLRPRTMGWTYAEAVSMAHSRRPDLSAALSAVSAARYGVRAAKSGYMPRIQASAGWGSRSSGYNAGRRLDGWTVGLVAQWNIFDGLENRGKVRMELANRRTAEIRLDELQLQIDSVLRELYAGMELARSAIDAQRAAADLGGRSLGQARRLHELGQVSLEQVLQAELTSRQAELGLFEAIFNHNATVAQIEYSIAEGFVPGTKEEN